MPQAGAGWLPRAVSRFYDASRQFSGPLRSDEQFPPVVQLHLDTAIAACDVSQAIRAGTNPIAAILGSGIVLDLNRGPNSGQRYPPLPPKTFETDG